MQLVDLVFCTCLESLNPSLVLGRFQESISSVLCLSGQSAAWCRVSPHTLHSSFPSYAWISRLTYSSAIWGEPTMCEALFWKTAMQQCTKKIRCLCGLWNLLSRNLVGTYTYQHASIKQNLLYSITEPTQELLTNVPDICCSQRLGFLASYFDSSTPVRSPLGNHPSHLWLSRSQQECFKPLSFVTGSGICDIVNR